MTQAKAMTERSEAAMSDMTVRAVARAIAGHAGPVFDELPIDKAERRAINQSTDTFFEHSQDDMIDAAQAAITAHLKALEEQGMVVVPRDMAKVDHKSDCAVYNAPAMEPGPCDCGAMKHEP